MTVLAVAADHVRAASLAVGQTRRWRDADLDPVGGHRVQVDPPAQKGRDAVVLVESSSAATRAVPGSTSSRFLMRRTTPWPLAVGDGCRSDRDPRVRRQPLPERRFDTRAEKAEPDLGGRRAPIEHACRRARAPRRRPERRSRRGEAAFAFATPRPDRTRPLTAGPSTCPCLARRPPLRRKSYSTRFMPPNQCAAVEPSPKWGESMTKGWPWQRR